MSNEIIEKLKQEQDLTLEEISFVLPEIVSKANESLAAVPLGNEKKCVEADKIMQIICGKFNIYYFPLDTRDLKNDNLFHKFGLVIFNSATKPVIFLTDLTYNQFKVEPEYSKISPFNFLKEEFFEKLKNDGYLPFTREIFENYIMSFVSANTKTNKNNFYDSIYNELNKFRINFNFESDFCIESKELSLGIKNKGI